MSDADLPSEAAMKAAKTRAERMDQAIIEALRIRHPYVVEALPEKMGARVFNHLGYNIVVERPQVETLDDERLAVRERWYLERYGEFVTGDKSLWRERYR